MNGNFFKFFKKPIANIDALVKSQSAWKKLELDILARSSQLKEAKSYMHQVTEETNNVINEVMHAALHLAERLQTEINYNEAVIFVRSSGRILFANNLAYDILHRKDLINATAVYICRDDWRIDIPSIAEAIINQQDISKILPGKTIKKSTSEFLLVEPMKIIFSDGHETQPVMINISLVDASKVDDITFVMSVNTCEWRNIGDSNS